MLRAGKQASDEQNFLPFLLDLCLEFQVPLDAYLSSLRPTRRCHYGWIKRLTEDPDTLQEHFEFSTKWLQLYRKGFYTTRKSAIQFCFLVNTDTMCITPQILKKWWWFSLWFLGKGTSFQWAVWWVEWAINASKVFEGLGQESFIIKNV